MRQIMSTDPVNGSKSLTCLKGYLPEMMQERADYWRHSSAGIEHPELVEAFQQLIDEEIVQFFAYIDLLFNNASF